MIFQFSEIFSFLGFLLVFSNTSCALNQSCLFELDMLPEKTYYITSPNYPENYSGSNSCKWNIKSYFQIHLNCEVFNVHPTSKCHWDYVLLFLNPAQAPLRLCGNSNFSRVSEGHEMTIIFQSDNNTPGGRFACYLQAIDLEENCNCGLATPTRIVGGENTGVNEFPMMAGIVDSLLKLIICGGVIITNKHVLTAAHCVQKKSFDKIYVVIGEHDVSTGTDWNATNFLRTQNYVMHPSFVPTKRNSNFDIAIITVTNDIQFTNEIGPACLPFQHSRDSFSGSFVQLLGWGSTEFAGPKSDILKKVEVSVINLSKCLRTYPKILDYQMCTLSEGKDACQYDSGGPVLWKNPTTKRLVVVGIILYGVSCGINIPSVNVRVGAFMKWIESVIGIQKEKKSFDHN